MIEVVVTAELKDVMSVSLEQGAYDLHVFRNSASYHCRPRLLL